MTLTLRLNCACRLCGAEFDPQASAMSLDVGRVSIPRVARRHLLPSVCDGCWDGFANWMAAKERAEHRRDAAGFHKYERMESRERTAAQTSRKYQRFSQEVLAEWLTEGLDTIARLALRGRLCGMATEANRRREAQRREYWQGDKSKRRNWSRYAPDVTPDWAKRHEC